MFQLHRRDRRVLVALAVSSLLVSCEALPSTASSSGSDRAPDSARSMLRQHMASTDVRGMQGERTGPSGTANLIIRNARVLDVARGRVLEDRSVVVAGGRIAGVFSSGQRLPAARDTLDAERRLLTPGLIDVHSHLAYVLGDSVSEGGGMTTRLAQHPDSIEVYRRRHASQYIPYGVTTIRDVGSSRADVELMLAWKEESRPWAPTVHPSGGALVTHEEGRTSFPGHRPVQDSADAARAVRESYDRGIRHLKLYWRLQAPELEAALVEARRLGMSVTGHIDYGVVPFDTVLDLGLSQFEHAYTIAVGALSAEELRASWRERLPAVIGDRTAGRFYLGVLEYFHEVEAADPEVLRLIRRLANRQATVTPTLHLFAQRLGLAYYDAAPVGDFDDTSGLTDTQLAHFRAGYRILADYVRRMHEQGIRLTVGTDWVEPGRAVLSEMLLLHQAGLPMMDVLRAATLNGARALGADASIGRIEPGYAADLILFERDPLRDPRALLSPKVVFNDGRVVSGEFAGSSEAGNG